MATRIGRLIGLAALLMAGLMASAASAATLYITEYASIGSIGSSATPWPPGAALATQTVAVGGSSTQSAAFNSQTHAVQVYCDVGCSVLIGSNPTAATTTTVLTAQQPQNFVVAPSQKIAVIANPSGDVAGGAGVATDVNLTKVAGTAVALGQTTMAASLPVAIASNQPAIDVGAGTAGTADASVVTVQGIASMTPVSVTQGPFSYSRQTADGQVKATAGYVHTVTLSPTGTVTAGVVTLYDSASETGTVIMSIALPITSFTPFSVSLDATAGTGLFIGFDATLANVQATVTYR